jgi:RNA polymerase sigma-70 factor (ECF subfamily)
MRVLAGNETALAEAVLRRDRKAAAELVERFADDVYSFVWNRLFPRVEHVDDLVQETFLAVWANLSRFQGQSALRHWILAIARNKTNDFYRRTWRERGSFSLDDNEDRTPEVVDGGVGVESLLVTAEHQEKIVEVLGKMRIDYSALLRSRYWDETPVREIAISCGRTEKAIERSLARARAEFRRIWEIER